MKFGLILASGAGSRMGITSMPKQFLNIGSKPIVVHTIETFKLVPNIDEIVVVVQEEWKSHLDDLLKTYNLMGVHIATGGETRHDSLLRGCAYIKENFKVDDETIIVSHDSVRPFVTRRIIEDNIKAIANYDVVDTIIPATDTIVEAKSDIITNIPNRDLLYMGQTPQTFKLNEFMSLCHTLTEEEKKVLTDACKIYKFKNKKLGYVNGEVYNFKITTKFDLKVASSIVEGSIKL